MAQEPDLFDAAAENLHGGPLAVRMRPRTLDEVVGQDHLLASGAPLRRLVEASAATGAGAQTGAGTVSVILWGPPGTGKTTLAHLVSHATGQRFVELSAVTAGVKDVRLIVDGARRRLATGGDETVLFVDEVHRFSKTQQDALLPAVENGWVTLIAATTENPHFAIVSPLLSRSILLTLRPLDDAAITTLIQRALVETRGLDGSVELTEDALAALVRLSGGDARRALNALEAVSGTALDTGKPADVDMVALAVDRAAVRYDRDGDQHYDVASALIKSIRGSDVDAALHYLARMIEAGEDPRFIARRLVIHASEDVGMADPSALQSAVAALHASQFVGLPEARLPLAQAVIHLSTAPKSNAVIIAIDSALSDVRQGLAGPVPAHLRDAHYQGAKSLGHGGGYRLPHDDERGVVEQQYAPDDVAGRRYYEPSAHGFERELSVRVARIRDVLSGGEES
ncbi:MAG: replication-associated recombination protein A [Candidatus Nanopelagicales bacterium]